MGEERKNSGFFSRMCMRLYDYWSKRNRYRKWVRYLENRVTTNQKHTTDSQKSKRKEYAHNTKKTIKLQKEKQKVKERDTMEIQNQQETKFKIAVHIYQ